MKGGPTGHYESTAVAGEEVQAFIPEPLPPKPVIELGGDRQRLLERALLACGRLKGVTALWSMSAVQDRELVIQAVLMALWQRQTTDPVILHSDRGSQFTIDDYQQFLNGHNLTGSMSAVGSCADNAAAEGFFGMLKRERVNRRQYIDRATARSDIFDYIECFYNPRQRRRLVHTELNKPLLTKQSALAG